MQHWSFSIYNAYCSKAPRKPRQVLRLYHYRHLIQPPCSYLARVQQLTPAWHEQLKALVTEFPQHVVGLKGLGSLVGLQMAGDALGWVGKSRAAGMLAPPAGGNVVRLLPPLNATAEELTESVEIFRRVLAAR